LEEPCREIQYLLTEIATAQSEDHWSNSRKLLDSSTEFRSCSDLQILARLDFFWANHYRNSDDPKRHEKVLDYSLGIIEMYDSDNEMDPTAACLLADESLRSIGRQGAMTYFIENYRDPCLLGLLVYEHYEALIMYHAGEQDEAIEHLYSKCNALSKDLLKRYFQGEASDIEKQKIMAIIWNENQALDNECLTSQGSKGASRRDAVTGAPA